MTKKNVVIVGGGLSGLTASVALAQTGAEVTLIEQTRQLGGRATTQQHQGFRLNMGPHAIYRNGPFQQMLDRWHIPYSGKPPDNRGQSWLTSGSQKLELPANAGGLLFASGFSLTEKLALGKFLHRASTIDPASTGDAKCEDWVDGATASPRAREVAKSLIRVGSYCDSLDQMTARAGLRQLQNTLKNGVLYIDGGWGKLIDGLRLKAISGGVRIETGEPAVEVQRHRVGMQSGRVLGADFIVLAVPPEEVQRLTGIPLPRMTPLRLASLDLCLCELPPGAPRFALGLDRPLYFSVHSLTADLAPQGKALVHVAKYLSGDPAGAREELEAYADLLMPGWRERLEHARFLPNAVASYAIHDGRRLETDGLGVEGLALAGDWVGNEYMLADASVASALQAASCLAGRRTAAA